MSLEGHRSPFTDGNGVNNSSHHLPGGSNVTQMSNFTTVLGAGGKENIRTDYKA